MTRVEGESVGTYAITVEDAVSGDPNYVVEVAPGSFTIVPADAVSLVVGGGTKVYDGTPLVPTGFTPSGLADGDYVEVVYSGSQTDAGSVSYTHLRDVRKTPGSRYVIVFVVKYEADFAAFFGA